MAGYGSTGPSHNVDPFCGPQFMAKPRMPPHESWLLPRTRTNIPIAGVVASLFLPWVMFALIFYVFSFAVHNRSPEFVWSVAFAGLLVIILLGLPAFLGQKTHFGDATGSQDNNRLWMRFLVAFVTFAWVLALIMGNANFTDNMQPYYDIRNLNTYSTIDVTKASGLKVMDAGIVNFKPDTKIDAAKAAAFRDLDLYCVAPLTAGADGPESYDFWVAGMNCCSGYAGDFHCGEWDNPRAKSGIRVMHDDEAQFYRLAVRQVASAQNIRADHPVFFTWQEDATLKLEQMHDAGLMFFYAGLLAFLCFQVCLVVFEILVFFKMS